MPRIPKNRTVVGLGLALVLFFAVFAASAMAEPAPPLSSSSEQDSHKEVRLHKVKIKCDGDQEDCKEKLHAVFIGKDGSHQIKLEGDDVAWVDADAGHHKVFVAAPGGGRIHSRTFLGVGLTDLTPELLRHFQVPGEAGVLVSKVVEGSPAMAAGIQVGDVLTALNGESVGSARKLQRAVAQLDVGDAASVEVWRDGRTELLTATVEENEKFHHKARRIVVHCDPEEDDCNFDVHRAAGLAFDCEGESCDISIECNDGECNCVVNGEPAECASLPGFHVRK